MSELYIPSVEALNAGKEFAEAKKIGYMRSETFRNRSKANRKRMLKYWSDERNHERVDPNAKAIDVFDMDGHYIDTYPSARKTAIALGIPHLENTIRAIRRGDPEKKSLHGYMFRDASPVKADIAPYSKLPKRQPRGYHRDNSNLRKPVRVIFGDGDFIDFESLKDCAEALGRKQNTVSYAVNHGTHCRGFLIEFI